MPVTPRDFLAVASDLPVSDEMLNRNAVSRAYYSGYLHVNKKVVALNLPLPKVNGGVHARLINGLNNGACSDLNNGISHDVQLEIAGLLSLSKQLRTKADYKLNMTINNTDKATAIANAKAVFALLP
ncbi:MULTISPECIES: hypothetical protein [Enterobacter]|uniref:hypothetical protein n=1 Tax=Enterobacter TaxID=547 RepID=UPI0007A06785|nr:MULTISPECIES: hypothetical protein [Enterobacter]KYQ78329.1 hypothetical protein AX755_09655 [Enterobacter sp. SENG-6]PPV39606.1 hypothetical protein C4L14_00645 [Enterobacter sp. RC4]WKE06043.1 hypothetical protein QOM25_11750 [Enterobacter asburiae]WKE08116.1 hypothetical protein QOM24_18880 [Enterobacter asburiae]